MSELTKIQVLLVEDDPEYLMQIKRDLPEVFEKRNVPADIHECDDFGIAVSQANNPLHRYDLIVSDTYRGDTIKGDAAVLQLVKDYQGKRFCPMIVFSSGVKPEGLTEGPFLRWVDKAEGNGIEAAINALIDTHILRLARTLHEELERVAGTYLWSFLEEKWEQLNEAYKTEPDLIERVVRRRAAIQIGDVDPNSGAALLERDAAEYYIYPAFDRPYYSLGDVLRGKKKDVGDFRVVLTPHCHLMLQPNQKKPRADHVLLVKAVVVKDALGEKLENAKKLDRERWPKKLRSWGQSPSNNDLQPAGRHWYLPHFLDIPHSFGDFMQVESVEYDELSQKFDRIATLTPPYAEAMQSCFAAFYGSVGIPVIRTQSIESLFE